MLHRHVFVTGFVLAALALGACGGGGGHERMNMRQSTTSAVPAGDAQDLKAATNAPPSRIVDVDMVDTAFQPNDLNVKKGQTVRFVFHNRGKVAHEAFFGDAEMQDMHDKAMNTTGASTHTEDMNEVAPGSSRTVDYTFDQAGNLMVGCHEAGHYAAGMKIAVAVQ